MAMGTLLVPTMLQKGYERHFAVGVVGASGTLGILIPPSLAMIIFAVIAEESVPRLFLAGVLPGLLQASLFAAWIFWYTHRKQYPKGERMPPTEFWRVNRAALPALLLPAIILGGIYSGIVTVTEAAGIAALVSILVSLIFYKGCRPVEVFGILAEAIKLTSIIFFIILGALAFGYWITSAGIADALVQLVGAHDLKSWQFLLLINVIMLSLGMFLEVIAVILIVVPLVLPLLATFDISPIQFAMIVTINMEIALLTPPVGLNLYVLSSISDTPIETVTRGVLPFIALMLILLGLVTFIPEISLFLPDFVYSN